MTLGVDWSADMAAEFAADFGAATITRVATSVAGAYVTGPRTETTATHTCKALGLAYERKYIDGTTVRDGDFKVIILRGTISPSTLPEVGQVMSVAPPGGSAAVTVRIVRVLAVTEGFVTVHVRGAGL